MRTQVMEPMSKTNVQSQDTDRSRVPPGRDTVLIMEEVEHADVYAGWLDEDYEVRVAYDGDEAIEAYDEDVEVAVLGRGESGISGDEVLEDIRELPGDCMAALITAGEPVDEPPVEFEALLQRPVDEEDIRGVTENLSNLANHTSPDRGSIDIAEENPSIHLHHLLETANDTDSGPDDLLEALTDTFTSVCTPAQAATWTFDEDDVLRLREYDGAVDEDEAAALLDGEKLKDVVWRAYSDEPTQQEFNADNLVEDSEKPEPFPDTCLSYRLGNHGVALVLPNDDGVDSSDKMVMGSAATIAGSMLENHRYEREVEEQRKKASEHRRLRDHLDELNGLIRETSTELIESTTRTDIEQTLCRQLTRSRFIGFAWIGEYVESGDKLTVKHSTDEEHMESLLDNGEKEPAKHVVLRGEAEITRSLKDPPPLEPWREKALRHGFRSVIRVPLRQDSSVEGVLTAYIDEPPSDFTYLSTAVEDLASIAGYAINSYEAKASLVLNKVTEIEARVKDPGFPQVRLASLADTNVLLEGIASADEGRYRHFLSFESHDEKDTREVVSEAAESMPAIESCKHISSRRDREAFEVTGDLFLREIVHKGGRPTSLFATAEEAELTVQAPKFVSASSFINLLEQEYDSVELLSKNDVDEGFDSFSEVEEILHSELTETEIETIKTAYYGGYFASPRESTGQDLGNELGVTQPTVTENIKSAEKKILRLLFDGIIDVDDPRS